MACGDRKHPAKGLAKKMQEKKGAPNPKAPVPLAKKMQDKKKK